MAGSAPRIFVITGEASGDLHGSNLIKEIKKSRPEIDIWAVGGEKMAMAGAKILIPSQSLSVVGILEVFSHTGPILSSFFKVRKWLRENRPDLLILIDFPEFNLLMARFAKGLGIRVFYYISPQLWAWRQGRVKKIKRYVDKMAVILPFEKEFYRRFGIDVEYVGHPLLDFLKSKEEYLNGIVSDDKKTLIGLLPGSRKREIETLLPVMLGTSLELSKRFKDLQFILPMAPGLSREVKDFIKNKVKEVSRLIDIRAEEGMTYQVLSRARFSIVASGTVTLEAAILDCPVIVVYKVSRVNTFIGKLIIRVPFVSLVNLIAGKEIVPELLQERCNEKEIIRASEDLLKNDKKLSEIKEGLREVRKRLGKGGASKRAAEVALSLIG